jgi:hypothetical protein
MIYKSLFKIIASLCFAYALLNPAAERARFISAGTLFHGSHASTVKKFRRISNRPGKFSLKYYSSNPCPNSKEINGS